jgi:hypothetical protein
VAFFEDNLAARFGLGSRLPVTGFLLLIALVLAPAILAFLAARVSRAASHVSAAGRELLCRLSMALIPLGVAMWAAHFLFHFCVGWDSAWTPVGRIVSDAGWHLASVPDRKLYSPLLGADAMRVLQTVLLDAGLLLALYLVWRISLSYSPRVGGALRLFAPWAGIAAGLYAVGVWIILQPMEMRGLAGAIPFT